MKYALCLLAASLVHAASVEDTIKANLGKFEVAAKAGDSTVLNALFADDLTYGHSSAKFETKTEAVAALVKTKPTYTHKDIKVRVYGNTATAHMHINVQPINVNVAVLQVWVKKGSNWQMVARHATRLNP